MAKYQRPKRNNTTGWRWIKERDIARAGCRRCHWQENFGSTTEARKAYLDHCMTDFHQQRSEATELAEQVAEAFGPGTV